MTNTQIIQSWKNPELRRNGVNHPSGQSFSELSVNEMMNIQGSGDVQPETTPATISSTVICAGTVTGTIMVSKKYC